MYKEDKKMSNGVTISVLTATYNREKTLNRVFNSLMNQTYKNFEWIIIDDGSKDNTFKLVEKFKDKANFPIKYYYQENQGKHIAMNKALEICSGEFCTSIDSDDEIKSNSLEILIKEWTQVSRNIQTDSQAADRNREFWRRHLPAMTRLRLKQREQRTAPAPPRTETGETRRWMHTVPRQESG